MKILVLTAALTATAMVTYGELFSFSAITANNTNGYAQSTGEAQLYMDIAELGTGQVSLIFTNTGPEESVISSIYFDYASDLSLSLATINDGDGVEFQIHHGKPNNLPAGQALDNPFISDLSVRAKNPGPSNGINPCESLELIVNYDGSYDLLGALENEALRIGLHVQSFAGGYSESYINVRHHRDTIPEPGTITMLLVGGFALRWLRIR